MKVYIRWISVAVIAAASPTVLAVENERIENIYISATRGEGPQLPVATTLTVIDREKIRLSGAQQLADVLRTQAGIQLRDNDGSNGRNVTVSMRGFGSNAANNTLVLVDGRRLNNPTLAGPALNTIPLRDVERIEIVQGSAGVLYGDQAVGGVINIVTRRVRAGEELAYIDLVRGSYDQEIYSATFSEGYQNGFSYRLSGQKHMADNYRDNNRQNLEQWLVNLGYDVEEGRLYYERQRTDDRLGLPGALTDEQAAENRRQSFYPNDYSHQNTAIQRMGGVWKFAPNWAFLTDYADRDERVEGYLGIDVDQRTQVQNVSPRIVGHMATSTGPATLTVGYDRVVSEFGRYSEWGDVEAEQQIDAYYTQLLYPLSRAVKVSVGQRRSQVSDTHVHTSVEHEAEANAKEIGLSYQLSGSLRVFGRRADGFRFANVDENAQTLPDVDFLSIQESQSSELGAIWRRAASQWQLSLYSMKVFGEIAYDAGAENPQSFNGFGANVNLPDAKRRGVLAEYSRRLGEHWMIDANYTYTDAELSAGANAGNEMPFVAPHTANVTLGYTPREEFSLYLDAGYTGQRYRLGDDANSESKLPSYKLLNLNMIFVDNEWELGLRVRNVTSTRYSGYQEAYGGGNNVQYPQPGRTYEARLTYIF